MVGWMIANVVSNSRDMIYRPGVRKGGWPSGDVDVLEGYSEVFPLGNDCRLEYDSDAGL